MVRIPKFRKHIGTRYEPYKLPPAACAVPSSATKESNKPRVAYIVGEKASPINATGQLKSCAALVSPATSISEARHNVFYLARSSACFRIFLFLNNLEITLASNFLSLSTFFWYSSRVRSNDS
jgi:hypothetical protein